MRGSLLSIALVFGVAIPALASAWGGGRVLGAPGGASGGDAGVEGGTGTGTGAGAGAGAGGAEQGETGKSPHEGSFADAAPCEACHTTTAWRERAEASGGAGFDHSTTGFPLTGQHVRVSCVRCHTSARPPVRYCSGCHEDAHRGRLSRSSCDACHIPAGWKLTRPLEMHRMTRFPLTGMHVLADCSECHRRASENRFTDAPVACYACHQREYARADLRPVHIGTSSTPAYSRDCSLCHRAIAWAPAVAQGVAAASLQSGLVAAPPGHDLRFPLAFGSHRTATCPDCHTSPTSPRSVRCIGCHAHAPTRILQQHSRPVSTDGAACIACHPGGVRR